MLSGRCARTEPERVRLAGSIMTVQDRGLSRGLLARSVALAVAVLGLACLAPPASRAFDAHRVEPSIYKIYTFIPEKDNQYSISSGSGFLIAGKRFVVTNFHVVEGGQRFYIAFPDEREVKLIE